MNDDVTALDVVFEHCKRVAARELEVLLDLDLDPLVSQRVAQRLAIVAELVRDAGKKELDVRQSPPPALWPWRQCGMEDRVRQRAGRRPPGLGTSARNARFKADFLCFAAIMQLY
jgi:hypothetical protein